MIAVARRIKVRKPGIAPIAIGTRVKWPAVFLFDVVLLLPSAVAAGSVATA